MIILKLPAETLTLTATTSANIDYSVAYADITTSTFVPGSNEGTMNLSTSPATILAAPAGSTQRQVKLISIVNHDVTSNTVTIKKLITATNYTLSPNLTLLAGESLQFIDSQGWVYYDATGKVKPAITAAGSNNQIQYNNSGGQLAGDSRLTYDPTLNSLVFSGIDPNITIKAITNEPSSPLPNQLTLYVKAVSGRMLPKWKAPSGVDTSFQPILAFNTVYTWMPATGTTAVGTGFGCTWPGCTGTILHPTVLPGLSTSIKVMQCTNIATTVDQFLGLTASTATLANVWRGNAAGQGGFFFQCRFKIMLIPAASIRIFVGLTSLTTAMVVNDTPTGDFCGFSHIITDNITTMTFVTRNNTTTTSAAFTVPTLAAGNTYDATIYSQPNGSAIYYRLVDLLTGLTLVDTDTSVTGNTTLPRNTIFMGPQVQMSNGANVTVTTTAIGINKIYLECDM